MFIIKNSYISHCGKKPPPAHCGGAGPSCCPQPPPQAPPRSLAGRHRPLFIGCSHENPDFTYLRAPPAPGAQAASRGAPFTCAILENHRMVIFKGTLEPRCSDQKEGYIIRNLKITTYNGPGLYNYIKNASKDLCASEWKICAT